jgi:anti-sigma factor RsiW
MLEAPPTALRPGTGSEIGRHLAECAACRRLAGRLLEGDEVLDRMLAAVDREAEAVERGTDGHRRKSRRKETWWGVGIAAGAAAATAAGLLLGRAPVRMNPDWWPAAAGLAPVVDVQVEAGDATAVFASRDRPVTVVWLNNRGGRDDRDTPPDAGPAEPKEMN